MLIDEIVSFCNSQYSHADTEHICESCQHEECSQSCKKCLEEIHYPYRYPNGKKDYDCCNLIYFYMCDYTYKYASEIWYLLRKSEVIKSIETFRILSIGCGGCPDLMAFESYLKENGQRKKISYLGIDKNELWSPIHNEIKNYRSNLIRTSFCYDDALELLSRKRVNSANVLVLQYVISHFYNTGQICKIELFYERLIENIILRKEKGKPFVILINDVNSNNRGRDLFESLCKKLADAGMHGSYAKYYFNYRIQNDYQRYGEEHTSNSLLYDMPSNLSKYEPWKYCSSAQMIIEISGVD